MIFPSEVDSYPREDTKRWSQGYEELESVALLLI